VNLNFYKLFTGRNDLVLINLLKEAVFPLELLPSLARKLCLRREGIGGSGVLFLFPGSGEPYRMRYFRPDGEETGLCNDALFCLSRYLFDSGMIGGKKLSLETAGGVRTVDLLDSQNFRLNLGTPLSEEHRPLVPGPDADFFRIFRLENRDVSLIPLMLQKRGAVFMDGGEFRGKHRTFGTGLNRGRPVPERRHPIFVAVHSRDEIAVDSPLDPLNGDHASSCALGGAGAVLAGLADREIFIRSRRSRYFFQWDQESGTVYLTGSASYAYSGSVYYEEPSGPDES